jgi:hypothetical protein
MATRDGASVKVELFETRAIFMNIDGNLMPQAP